MFSFWDFFAKDESANWKEVVKIPLSMNLQMGTLNGIRLVDPLEKLSILGRPDNKKAFKDERFIYSLLGLEIGGYNGKIDGFTFVTNRTFYPGSKKPFAHCEITFITYGGRHIYINKSTNLRDIETVFGIPTEKEEYPELNQTVSIYNTRDSITEFECSYDGSITEISVDSVID